MAKKSLTEILVFKMEWERICQLLREVMTYDIPIVPML